MKPMTKFGEAVCLAIIIVAPLALLAIRFWVAR